MKPLWPLFLPSRLSLPLLTAEVVCVFYILVCDSSSVQFANEVVFLFPTLSPFSLI